MVDGLQVSGRVIPEPRQAPHANYDMPDGKHFIFLEPDDAGELIVVSNWASVLRARMAGGRPR